MPISFQSPTPTPPELWKRPEAAAAMVGLLIQAGGLVGGLLTQSVVLAGIALGGAALIGAAFTLARRG